MRHRHRPRDGRLTVAWVHTIRRNSFVVNPGAVGSRTRLIHAPAERFEKHFGGADSRGLTQPAPFVLDPHESARSAFFINVATNRGAARAVRRGPMRRDKRLAVERTDKSPMRRTGLPLRSTQKSETSSTCENQRR